MPYDEIFYQRYREYLKEGVVRKNHDRMFELLPLLALPNELRVIDLGCGTGEYITYDQRHALYAGVDLNNTGNVAPFIQRDYCALDFAPLVPFTPNAFVSLFSIECSYPPEAKYGLYSRIFSAFPHLRCGLSAGFYYESRRDQPTVTEAGEIESYQTIEKSPVDDSYLFRESRILLRTPSEMFGQDVVEVWKFFVRK